jgi:threonine synthase
MTALARAWFRCSAGCQGDYPLTQVVYRCPKCGQLLEVAHDIAILQQRSPAQWKQLFSQRRMHASSEIHAAHHASGVWSKQELVAPAVDVANIVSMGEGGSHLTPVPRYAAMIGAGDVRIKQCGISHTGSFKDLGMTVLVSMVKQMITQGTAVRAIACASTGDTSAALAAYAAAAGIRAVVILPRGKISTAQLVQPLANGALVLAIDTDFDGCMALVQQLAEREHVYLANSMNSLRLEGQKTVAIEIVEQLGWQVPDWIIIPGGNLGNVAALGAGFDLMLALGLIDRKPRICVAQAAHASPLYNSYVNDWAPLVPVKAITTLASAIQIGNPVSFAKAVRTLKAYDGVVEIASEAQLANACARADVAGMFTCPHTGVALAALEQLIAKRVIAKSQQCVVISTANGLKFTDFKVRYHEEPTVADASSARSLNLRNTPIALGNDYHAVREALLSGL